MKKSELKQIIQEIVKEVISEDTSAHFDQNHRFVLTNYSSGFVVHANLVAATVASGVSVLVTPSANIWVQSGTTASALV
jgi:hypothetical protein